MSYGLNVEMHKQVSLIPSLSFAFTFKLVIYCKQMFEQIDTMLLLIPFITETHFTRYLPKSHNARHTSTHCINWYTCVFPKITLAALHFDIFLFTHLHVISDDKVDRVGCWFYNLIGVFDGRFTGSEWDVVWSTYVRSFIPPCPWWVSDWIGWSVCGAMEPNPFIKLFCSRSIFIISQGKLNLILLWFLIKPFS